VTEVEIFWPTMLSPDAALEAEAFLRERGIQATCRLQPVRRGSETVLILLTSAALEPFLRTLSERIGGEAWNGLRTFVRHLLGHARGQAAPTSVIFESAASGAQFVFTTDLPEDAFRQAITIDPGPGPKPGRWAWDDAKGRWLRFENR